MAKKKTPSTGESAAKAEAAGAPESSAQEATVQAGAQGAQGAKEAHAARDARAVGDAKAPRGAQVSGDSPANDEKPVRRASWFRLTVIILFGLLYAWDLFAALSNLFGKLDELARRNEVRVLNGFAPIDTPWALLIANLLLPVVVFGLALLIARKRNVGVLSIVLLAGLGVVAAVSLTLIALVLLVA